MRFELHLNGKLLKKAEAAIKMILKSLQNQKDSQQVEAFFVYCQSVEGGEHDIRILIKKSKGPIIFALSSVMILLSESLQALKGIESLVFQILQPAELFQGSINFLDKEQDEITLELKRKKVMEDHEEATRYLSMKGKNSAAEGIIMVGKPYKQGTQENGTVLSYKWINGLEKIGLLFSFNTEAFINYIHLLVKSKTAQSVLSNKQVNRCDCKIRLDTTSEPHSGVMRLYVSDPSFKSYVDSYLMIPGRVEPSIPTQINLFIRNDNLRSFMEIFDSGSCYFALNSQAEVALCISNDDYFNCQFSMSHLLENGKRIPNFAKIQDF